MMFAQQFLDPISIQGVFLLIVLLLLAAYEVGFRIGRWWQIRTPEETEGPTSVNDVIDANEARSTAIINARVPETVVILLILGAGITLGMVGYSAGLTRRRSPLTAGVLVVLLAVVLTLVIDLDRPRNGFIQVSQQPILDLMTQIGPP